MHTPATLARDPMSDLPDLPGSLPAGFWGVLGASVLGGILWLRRFLSGDAVDRAADASNIQTIERLQALYQAEQARADALMREREGFIREIGDLKAQVALLTDQVKYLTNSVNRLRNDPTTNTANAAQGEG